jgi:murein DD-endopeptidase MepM/ murein hydrolase activator NlpD
MLKNGIVWPLQSNVIRRNSLSNTFGNVRKNADGTSRPHQGWDFSAKVGTDLYSIGSGEVQFIVDNDAGAYGLQICIAFTFEGQKFFAFYAHLNKVGVSKGEVVESNSWIGMTGESGNAKDMPVADQHLHFEVRTVAHAGLGLPGRVSPLKIFGRCPLQQPIAG